MGEQSRSRRLARAVAVFGIGIPLVVLAALYTGSRVTNIEFGTVLFVSTGAAALAWVAFVGGGRRMDAARPSGELSRQSATTYGMEVSRGTHADLPLPTRVLFALTGTVILGWTLFFATL
ncbi:MULTISPECIES: hypothetical protein [Halorussus]|uniref:hypothetical protein n=1 Tax=Halorussus TaxID=1070314 RepID=UPI000E20EBEF|nr:MULTISPECIES: hypothetical protein [Halorussus]NHN59752.1 hypothetical protein [Halorussus sp. JP-T4]